MTAKKNEVWLANLHPNFGTEKGKTRPVVVLQTDALNELHPSTLICPITTNVQTKSFILRVHLPKGTAGLRENCDIMIDQLRAIDNRRLIKKIGTIPVDVSKKIRYNIRIVLDLE